ncbi:MAG: diguanylate cyclase [Microthrixaceae bacterium]
MHDPVESSEPIVRPDVEYSLLRRSAFANMDAQSILTAEFDSSGHVIDFRFAVTNMVASNLLKKPMVELLGNTVSEVLPESAAQIIKIWSECLASGVALLEEIEIDEDTDNPRWIRQQVLPLGNAVAVTSHDITDRWKAESELRSLAHQDPLTELPNRRAALSGICSSLDRYGTATPTTVLFVDLDRFKAVNDNFGHAAGDELLRQIAARLSSVLRSEDLLARFGGDEFVICLDGATAPHGVSAIVEKLIDALRVPFRVGASDVSMSASIGVASSSSEWIEVESTANLLVHQADIAAYEAKRMGRDRVAVFDASIGRRAERESMVARELRTAIGGAQLQVYYLPQVELETLRPIGLEALLRWEHPEHGLLAAAEFLPIAEDAGLMGSLGRWMRQAGLDSMQRVSSWSVAEHDTELTLWFKVAQCELDDSFVSLLIADVAANGLHPSVIGVEIQAYSSDSFLHEASYEQKVKIITDLHAQGFRVSLTEVAASSAAMSALQVLPADSIKLQWSTVSRVDDPDLATRTALLGILSVMGELGQQRGARLVAGGVERESQLHALRQSGFYSGSGHLWSEAVDEDSLMRILAGMYSSTAI